MKRTILLLVSHLAIGGLGFAVGIYALPILIAPPSPMTTDLDVAAAQAQYQGEFRRDLKDSDRLHWGEGTVYVGAKSIALKGSVAPGPDYKLYLSPEFVETEADFNRLKSKMLRVGEVKTFENFLVALPPGVDPAAFNTVVVWCESFSQFISAAKYR
ncbi:MAG TPA: DM13 domain-containing protein [Burkholderiales bacterium]|nr:DM13 domain-containing protein [Burkholderiales bacterium]